MGNKTKLHPAIHELRGPFHKKDNGSQYIDFHIEIKNICLEFHYDSKDETWVITSPHVIDNAQLRAFLNSVYSKFPEGFDQDICVRYGDVKSGSRFYAANGDCFIKPFVCEDLAIRLDDDGSPSGHIVTFADPNYMVFSYEEEE